MLKKGKKFKNQLLALFAVKVDFCVSGIGIRKALINLLPLFDEWRKLVKLCSNFGETSLFSVQERTSLSTKVTSALYIEDGWSDSEGNASYANLVTELLGRHYAIIFIVIVYENIGVGATVQTFGILWYCKPLPYPHWRWWFNLCPNVNMLTIKNQKYKEYHLMACA